MPDPNPPQSLDAEQVRLRTEQIAQARSNRYLEQLGKVEVADQARLMCDNQATLNTTNAADRRNRAYNERLREAMFRRQFPEAPPAADNNGQPEDEMRIAIDSPTIHHHAPPPPGLGPWGKAAVVAAALALGGAGGLTLAGVLGFAKQAAVAPPTTDPTKYDLRLLPPEKKGLP